MEYEEYFTVCPSQLYCVNYKCNYFNLSICLTPSLHLPPCPSLTHRHSPHRDDRSPGPEGCRRSARESWKSGGEHMEGEQHCSHSVTHPAINPRQKQHYSSIIHARQKQHYSFTIHPRKEQHYSSRNPSSVGIALLIPQALKNLSNYCNAAEPALNEHYKEWRFVLFVIKQNIVI